MASSSWAGYGPAAPPPTASRSADLMQRSSSGDRPKKSQSRQLLSCTKCRERKVKCDRTKPCSACCARGHPKECEFVVGEGNDYSPIQQSYEIRKLRAENQRLKERLQAARLSHSSGEDDDGDSSEHKGSKTASRAATARQRRFKTGERTDNLYFGTPGLANIVSDFANLHVGNQSLTHTMPKLAQYMYTTSDSMYPFPTLWTGSNTSSSLVQVLPAREELFDILDSFQKRSQACSFPHTPDEVTQREVERFLADTEGNAERFPDMLALIFIALATGLQMGQYDRSGGQWVAGAVEATRKKSDVYLAASMQALRLASYMNQPTLLGIQTLVMIGPYLTNSGRFLDAWTLFGTTIRMAHSIGLHRNPAFLEPAPPLRECMVRQNLWWWMLHMDQQYSVTLGRPLGISGFGDCPPPEPLTTNPTILRLGEFVDHFTILARQILSSDGLVSVAKIDEFTDKLVGLWDTMPEALQFNESWLRQETALPDWPLEVMSAVLFAKVQSFLILLNRQRIERTQSAAPEGSSPTSMLPPPRPPMIAPAMPYSAAEPFMHPAPLRGRALVINSSIHLLQAFLFFYHRNPAVLICWTMGQQAFNACMILILDAWETENEQTEWLINQAYVVFVELEQKGVHKLAQLAVQRISDGLLQLETRRAERERQQELEMSSRRSSFQQQHQHQQHQPPPPTLTIDTASMTDWSGDTVMGNTGMFLLEDPGLQTFHQPPFQPLGWNMAGSAHPSHPSNPPTPSIPTPTVPVSQVTVAPFPVMTVSPPFVGGSMPVTTSPYAVGLQPRLQPLHPRRHAQPLQQPLPQQGLMGQQAAFTPINASPTIAGGLPGQHQISPSMQQQQTRARQHQQQQQQQQSFSQLRGPRHNRHNPGVSGSSSGASGGPRDNSMVAATAHRLDRPPGSSSGGGRGRPQQRARKQ